MVDNNTHIAIPTSTVTASSAGEYATKVSYSISVHTNVRNVYTTTITVVRNKVEVLYATSPL